ncbi:MAG: zinc-ribbon domain containing protein, partial [Clostridiales bacterium]|nr:zinc-ribbon domain containing protein [Clostridiales bacterium]
GEQFVITEEEQKNYKNKGYRFPKRCKSCRKDRRDEDKFFEDEVVHLIVEKELEKRRISAQSVKHKHFDKPLGHCVKNLFIIGNGFDIWCGLNTRYSDFEEFYENNKIRISWDLGIEPCDLMEEETCISESLTQFDLLYFMLNANGPSIRAYDSDFWSDFENSLSELDDFTINMYFGKEIDDIKDIRIDCDYAYEIIRKSFSEWIKSIDSNCNSIKDQFRFNDSLFVNFNYTDTLVCKFGIDENNVIHIHGNANDTESIIFGHGKSVDTNPSIIQLGRRFAGLYIIETVLKKFYKNPPAQWQMFQKRLQNKGADFKEVEDVYILGHSLGKADKYY